MQYYATGPSRLIQNVSTNLYMSRSQLREQICQTRKSDRQEWQSLVVLNGTKIFLNGTNISFLEFIYGLLNRGVANFFWNHVIQTSSRQMYFQDIYSNLWKVKEFIGNIYSLESNTYFWGTVMFVQDEFLYLIVTKHKLTVCIHVYLGLRQINNCRKVPLQVNFFYDDILLSLLWVLSCYDQQYTNINGLLGVVKRRPILSQYLVLRRFVPWTMCHRLN